MNMFPHTVTLYYNGENPDFTPVTEITVLKGVFYDAAKAANVVKSGLEGADAVNLYVPFDVEAVDGYTGQPRQYVSPKAFEAAEDKSGIWTLDVGQKFFFVKGEVIANLNFQSMNAKYDNVHRITKVDEKDFGTPYLQHWEVGGA